MAPHLSQVKKAAALVHISYGLTNKQVAKKVGCSDLTITPISYLSKLADSMPRRMQRVIEAGGNMTKY